MNKMTNLIILCLLIGFSANSQNPFITIWKTENPGVSNTNEIRLPASGEYSYEWEEMGNPANTGSGTAVN